MRAGGTTAAAVALGATVAIALAGCGSATRTTSAGTRASGPPASSAPATSTGPVKVLYAGSLANLIEHDLGPAFDQATGDDLQGYGSGSTELAQQIKDGTRRADVFISASPDADTAAGSAVAWYATFAKAPVVIGYNPHSRFASDFRSEPWYRVIAEPGIRVGRTDPKLDPKGIKTVAAIDQATAKLHMPDLKKVLDSENVYPESALVGRLQAGQLDAGFFYANEATEQGIPTVGIAPAHQAATYTVTVLRGAPDPRPARRFVSYLLSDRGSALLRRHGLTVIAPPRPHGNRAAVPGALRAPVGPIP